MKKNFLRIALGVFVWMGMQEGSAMAVSDQPSAVCRSEGESFSVGGVPGPEGWPQDEINCCPGLTDRERKEDYDGACQNQLVGGYAGRCIACGDGVCNERFESRCNCPEDCSS